MGIGRRPGRPDSLSRVLDAQRLSVRGRIEAFVRLRWIGSIIPKIGDQGFDGGLGARVGTDRIGDAHCIGTTAAVDRL